MSKREFRAALPTLGFGAGGRQAIDTLFSTFDLDANGTIEFSELNHDAAVRGRAAEPSYGAPAVGGLGGRGVRFAHYGKDLESRMAKQSHVSTRERERVPSTLWCRYIDHHGMRGSARRRAAHETGRKRPRAEGMSRLGAPCRARGLSGLRVRGDAPARGGLCSIRRCPLALSESDDCSLPSNK